MHTPGPWKPHQYEIVGGEMAFTVDAGDCEVCDCSSVLNTEEERRDNARLIAAAPTMLEALYEAELCLAEVVVHNAPVLVNVRAALDKAEGEQ